MAKSVVFSLASKVLSTMDSPAFKMAYEKGVSIWEAGEELDKLKVSMETIQAVLLDAERKQEDSFAVTNWIKRLKSVLYDAEDLFDEFVTKDLIKQHMMEGKSKLSLKNKVRVYCSKLNPVVSKNSIAKKVKDIGERLAEISTDMAQFQFVRCLDEKPVYNMGRGEDRGCFVDADSVIGRDEDKKIMLDMIINELDSARSDTPVVHAIVGIGGMGKTTLAQLIFNDEKIENTFEKRWFAYISDKSGEREVLGNILQSIREEDCSNLSVGQLHEKIRESVKDKKYLLVLDDVWEDDHIRWQDRMSLLSSHARESRILVTTRLPLVAEAVGALRPHNLEGLSEYDAWSLFKKLAFKEGYEDDTRRESLGKQILKKCSGVPLAIWTICGLLYERDSIAEWESIESEDLPGFGRSYNDRTMSVLKLSYDHLPSHLKQCFAYCCLFPKGYLFSEKDLINHWIAQGYTDPDEESSFLHLLGRGFFQQAQKGGSGEIESYKMQDLMYDLARYVAGEEIIILSTESSNTRSSARHVSFEISNGDESFDISTLGRNSLSLRSLLLFTPRNYTIESSNLKQLFGSVKLLRTLGLSGLGVHNIPPSIGELKFMRHLDLSHNSFEELPESVVNLVNLLSLNLESCIRFKVWPLGFHKLSNLRCLNIRGCDQLRLMPTEIGKMTRLLYLSDFKTEKGNESLNASAMLVQQLRGHLSIQVSGETESYVDGEDCNWQLPVSLYQLEILGFRGMRIPGWGDQGLCRLENLKLIGCTKVKYLPSLRSVPTLRSLLLEGLTELEFMEEEEDGSIFFPCLEELRLRGLVNLTRWWRKVAVGVTIVEFPSLRELFVNGCLQLEFESFPQCPQVKGLRRSNKSGMQLSPFLQEVYVKDCMSLTSIEVEAPVSIEISYCLRLKNLQIADPNAVKEFSIKECPELITDHQLSPS